jgi:hypothetical protein
MTMRRKRETVSFYECGAMSDDATLLHCVIRHCGAGYGCVTYDDGLAP